MGWLKRERLYVNVLIAVVAAFVADQTILRPYLEAREALADQRDAGLRAVQLGKLTLGQEQELRHFLRGDGASMMSDSAVVEGQLLHLIHDWEQQTGVTNLSFLQTIAAQEHGFTRLTFALSANGALGPIAGLIYRVETSPIPLRIESAVIHVRAGGAQVLQVNLTVSALCRGKPQAPAAPPANTQDSEVRL
jgi:hypothetical protein